MKKLISLAIFFIAFPSVVLATTYPLPKHGNDIIGHVFTAQAQPGDTIGSLGLRYGMSLHEMMEANPGTNISTTLRSGQKVIVPAQFILPKYRKGIVINMAELRMYYFPSGGKYVMTFPVAMGRDQWRTPTTMTSVISKERNPVWNVPDSIRAYTLESSGKVLPKAVQSGPDNPLGKYALHLGAAGYLIHGNNVPSSIGKFVSSGCIRMNNADIKTLFNIVPVGTPVYIIHHPIKVGWFNGQLYLEAQQPVQTNQEASALNNTSIEDAVESALNGKAAYINWSAANHAAEKHTGIPQLIGQATTQQAINYEAAPPLPIQTSMDNTSDDAVDDDTITTASAEEKLFAAPVTDLSHDISTVENWETDK